MKIKELAEKYNDYVIEQRRWCHQHAELSWKEFETTAHIEEELRKMGVTEIHHYEGLTGLWAMIRGGKAKEGCRTILLRADIDALPTIEKNEVPYKSQNEGVMHACGHDSHVAMLLAGVKILMDIREELEGNVKLIFQGGEETAIGAKYYVDRGICDDVQAVYGSHISTWGKAPYIDVNSGPRTASTDEFHITVQGKAAHGGMPQCGHDAIVAASAIIMNLQTLVSRLNDPMEPLVVTVGKISGGFQYNLVAGKVEMEGTVRAYGSPVQKNMDKYMKEMAEAVAKGYGCSAEVDYQFKTPAVIHTNEMMNKLVKDAAIKLYGEEGIMMQPPVTGGDDFAYFCEKVPGFFAFIGARNPEIGCDYPHHHECFNIDESVLKRGAAMYAQVAADFVNQKN